MKQKTPDLKAEPALNAKTFFSKVEISPEEILAADSDEFVIRLVIGPDYPKESSRLLFDFQAMLGTSCPNFFINEASGYVEVYIDNPNVTWAKQIWDFKSRRLATREHPPHREAGRMVVLDLSPGLKEGDVLELHWGETTRGFGPGAKVASIVPRAETWCRIDIRCFADPERALPDYGRNYEGYRRPLPDAVASVSYRILPREPRRLRVIRQQHRALLIPHDRFWNVAEVDDISTLVEAPAKPRQNEQKVFEYQNKNIQIRSKGLPLLDHAPMDDVFEGMNLYWGDIHSHSAISIDCVTNSRMDMMPDDLMRFARDRAGLDFYAVTDHHVPAGGPVALLQRDEWERITGDAEKLHDPGRFVTFPAFELSNPRGDVVFILRDPLPYDRILQDWKDVRDAWKSLKGEDYISIPHFHGAGFLPEGTWWENPDFACEPVIEILSDHGSYEREDVWEQGRAACKTFRFDRCGKFFLQQGYRYGFVANGDDHKGHVGVNGVTAVFARELTRDSILEAYRKRRVYGTSNARIRMVFTANGHLMGSEVPNAGVKELFIDVTGESRLKKIDIFRDGEHFQMLVPEGNRFTTTLRVHDEAPGNWYVRATQHDNHVAISSPVWFTS